jgi:hypothetical protein
MQDCKMSKTPNTHDTRKLVTCVARFLIDGPNLCKIRVCLGVGSLHDCW